MNDEEIREHLIQIKGVGEWTIDMFLIFALNRKNVLLIGDLGIRRGFMKVFNLRKTPDETHMKRLASPYDGELTKFTIFLWSKLD
jgi:DNA-3-methyladenine glycosylase II